MMRVEWDDKFCKERSENIKQQLSHAEIRLEKLENHASKISKLSVQMGEIIKYHCKQIDDQNIKINELERKPAENMGLIKNTAISAVVSGMIAYIISMIFN